MPQSSARNADPRIRGCTSPVSSRQGRCSVPLLPQRTRPSISLVQRDLACGGSRPARRPQPSCFQKKRMHAPSGRTRGNCVGARLLAGEYAGYERQGGQCDGLTLYNRSVDGGVKIKPSLRGLPFTCCTNVHLSNVGVDPFRRTRSAL
jgi:hypothetical protein